MQRIESEKAGTAVLQINFIAALDNAGDERETGVIAKSSKPVAKLVSVHCAADDIYNLLQRPAGQEEPMSRPRFEQKFYGLKRFALIRTF